jgi:hypothetical protein
MTDTIYTTKITFIFERCMNVGCYGLATFCDPLWLPHKACISKIAIPVNLIQIRPNKMTRKKATHQYITVYRFLYPFLHVDCSVKWWVHQSRFDLYEKENTRKHRCIAFLELEPHGGNHLYSLT